MIFMDLISISRHSNGICDLQTWLASAPLAQARQAGVTAQT